MKAGGASRGSVCSWLASLAGFAERVCCQVVIQDLAIFKAIFWNIFGGGKDSRGSVCSWLVLQKRSVVKLIFKIWPSSELFSGGKAGSASKGSV